MFSITVPLSGLEYELELHHRIVAMETRLKWHEFLALSVEEQNSHIAAYESKARMDAVVRQAEARKSRQRSRHSGK